MRAQQLGQAVGAELRTSAHGVEERRHRVRVKSRSGEGPDPDAVRFVFVLAREVDLLLYREALDGRDSTHGRVAAGNAAEQDGRNHGRGGDEAGA